MEFTRLVKTVLKKDVQPQGEPDHQLIAQLAVAMGHVTVVHKGKHKAVQHRGEPNHRPIAQLAAAMGHVTVVHKGKQKDVQP
jgi:sorbitol-specific phosphotransferase system component IIA